MENLPARHKVSANNESGMGLHSIKDLYVESLTKELGVNKTPGLGNDTRRRQSFPHQRTWLLPKSDEMCMQDMN